METYLGQIEKGNDRLSVYGTQEGYTLKIFKNNEFLFEWELFDSEHVERELRHRGFIESYIDVIVSML